MPSLIHCLYSSAASRPFEPAELHELLAVARRKNQAIDVTGMLLYVDGSFFQVLEGEEATVDRLYQHIALDPRHTKCTLIIREPIAARAFSDWSMGYAQMTASDLSAIAGTNAFFRDDDFLSGLDDGRARKLLAAFGAGRWRTKLDIPSRSSRKVG